MTIQQVRQLPYDEFLGWQIYSLIEPWGYENDEYRWASLMSILFNANRGKHKAKEPADIYRDYAKALQAGLDMDDERSKFEAMSPEEKRLYVMHKLKQEFGAIEK